MVLVVLVVTVRNWPVQLLDLQVLVVVAQLAAVLAVVVEVLLVVPDVVVGRRHRDGL